MRKLLLIPLLLLSICSFGQTSLATYSLPSATGTDTYSYSPTTALTLTNGATLRLKFTNANTTTSTLNISGTGAVALTKADGTALSSGDIAAGSVWWVIYDSGASKWKLTGGSGGSTLIFNSPLSETGGTVTIANAAADGSTKGAASFGANDFDASSGNITFDYTNATKATTSQNGILTNTDWNTFNVKQSAITFGTGVQTALGVNIGSAGAPMLFNGAGGTPSSLTGTNITGIPESGVTNLTSDLSGKQATLVSGTNIKTINSTSLLGSGDIVISSGLTIGSTAISSGTTTKVLYDNAGTLGEYTVSGSGNVAMTTSPVFTTPNIGTATGSITGNSATVTTNANLTGPITSVGNATSVAAQTGTGSTFVMNTSPTLVTPTLGVASATSINTVVISGSSTPALTVTGTSTISGTNTGDQTTVSGNAGTATALQTSRTIGTITGDATSAGSSFDGTANNTNAITVTKINGTSLAGLATGIVKNTTSTGVPSIAVAGDFPTLNQNTTGSAATLTTSRKINQVSFNGSADIKLNSRSSKTANYSVVSTDAMTTIMANPSADITFTIDQLTADDWILVKNKGTFNVLFAAGSGVTITGLTTLGPGYDALIYFDTNTAVQITGGGVATNGVSVVYKNMTTTGVSGSSETTLFTYTLPAGTLATNGESILIQSAGTYATSVNSKTLKFKFGGTTVTSGALAITTTAPWWLEATVIRVDATNQKVILALITGSSTQLAEAVYSTATETLSGTVTISITGQGGATNDVVGEFVKMKKEGF